MHTIKYPPIQNQDALQVWTRSIHSRLSHQNHEEDKENEIPSMEIGIDVVHTAMDISGCMSVHDIQATLRR